MNDKVSRRSFIACPVPPALATTLLARLDGAGFGETRRTRVADCHLTLAFIGDVDGAGVESLCAELHRSMQQPQFSLRLTRIEGFAPTGGRYVVALSADSSALRELRNAVTGALERCGIDYDRRGFTPHITLARSPPSGPGLRIDLPAGYAVPITSLALYRGAADDAPTRYEIVCRIDLPPLPGC